MVKRQQLIGTKLLYLIDMLQCMTTVIRAICSDCIVPFSLLYFFSKATIYTPPDTVAGNTLFYQKNIR